MDHELRRKIAETRDIFAQFVWPIWQQAFDARELIATEGSEKEFERKADLAGIDAFFARRLNGTLIPIASRIEFARADDVEVSRGLGRRFTVRTRKRDRNGWHEHTEMRRLLDAASDSVARRYLPFRTFQTLVKSHENSTEVLFTSAVCTIALCKYLTSIHSDVSHRERPTRERDAKFISIPVSELRAAGIVVDSRP